MHLTAPVGIAVCQDMFVDSCHRFTLHLCNTQRNSPSSFADGSFHFFFQDFLHSLHPMYLSLISSSSRSGLPDFSVLCRLLTSANSGLVSFISKALPTQSAYWQISPGNCAVFHLIYLLYLLSMTFGNKDFVLFGKLIQSSLA